MRSDEGASKHSEEHRSKGSAYHLGRTSGGVGDGDGEARGGGGGEGERRARAAAGRGVPVTGGDLYGIYSWALKSGFHGFSGSSFGPHQTAISWAGFMDLLFGVGVCVRPKTTLPQMETWMECYSIYVFLPLKKKYMCFSKRKRKRWNVCV